MTPTAAVLGAGTIGLSWAALSAAHGMAVRVQDPRPDLREQLGTTVTALAPVLGEGLGERHLGPGMARRWNDRGQPELTAELVDRISADTEALSDTGLGERFGHLEQRD